MKVLYTGGGTMGSVSPLLAIHKQLKDSKALWIGTQNGIEKEVVKKAGIKYKAIASGKLRRYFDLQNLLDILKIIGGFFQALYIILKFQPDVIVSAGSFVAVPVIWAADLNNVPCIIHQQDVRPGLANKLMTPFAKKITVALEKSLKDYPKSKVVLVGNPISTDNKTTKQQTNYFNNELPIILVMGGGTGALSLNELVWESLDELTKVCNVIHLTGRGKNQESRIKNQENYKSFEFLSQEELFPIINDSDLVVSRAGMSALTELAYFSKPTVIVPILNSHQEDNAKYFAEKEAGVYFKQNSGSEEFIKQVQDLIQDKDKMKNFSKNINKIFIDYTGNKIVEMILSVKNKK